MYDVENPKMHHLIKSHLPKDAIATPNVCNIVFITLLL
jgi:hypothetical protein